MKLPQSIRKIKAIISMSTGKIVIEQARKNRFLLASIILNASYILKLIFSILIIYLIFFTNVRPKNAPDWAVLIEMGLSLLLCVIVFYSTQKMFKYRKELRAMKDQKNLLRSDIKERKIKT